MKLLVFEYSSTCLYDNLLSEGFNMLNAILTDLENDSSFDVYYLINANVNSFKFNKLNAINLNEDLCGWLNKYSNRFDYCLFIAPEDNLIQYGITKILEQNNVKVIGCDSGASYICSSKDLTYKHVPENILKIKSFKYRTAELKYENIKDKIGKNPFVIKPDDRTSSDLIFIIDNRSMFERIKEIYLEKNIEYLLVQEYVEGTPISVSLVCNNKDTSVISINSQEICESENKIRYLGCKTPIKHPLEKELYEISRTIVQSILGLKGFVGIDYIIQNNNIFFVEINSRITTPYIVLQKNCKENLTDTIIDYFINDNDGINLTFEKEGKFIR